MPNLSLVLFGLLVLLCPRPAPAQYAEVPCDKALAHYQAMDKCQASNPRADDQGGYAELFKCDARTGIEFAAVQDIMVPPQGDLPAHKACTVMEKTQITLRKTSTAVLRLRTANKRAPRNY